MNSDDISIYDLIKKNDVDGIKTFIKDHNLVIKNGKIVPKSDDSRSRLSKLKELYDHKQGATKVKSNSLYGCLLQPSAKIYDQRLGKSTTTSGRSIVRNMISNINEIITGEFDYRSDACCYSDTDSCAGSTIIRTDIGAYSIENLFNMSMIKWIDGDKEYATDDKIKVTGYNALTRKSFLTNFDYIYRHKVKKKKYKITDSDGNTVFITEDHSVMVYIYNTLMEIKPVYLKINDVVVSLMDNQITKFVTIAFVEECGYFDDEYVYDIGINGDNPYFFGDDILLHNSCYFKFYDIWKNKPEFSDVEWTPELIIEIADQIAEETNSRFSEFMQKTFHINEERSKYLKAAREIVASKALFIKKKKYAAMVIDSDGKRCDTEGKPGKLKYMGLDIKRSDTSKLMQEKLQEWLIDILTGSSKEELYKKIKDFRREMKDILPYEWGTPKKINGLLSDTQKLAAIENIDQNKIYKISDKTKVNISGHSRASINWNKLCDLHNDLHAMRITDGSKIIVCKLKPNSYRMDSVAYPIDEMHLPGWFKELPFDVAAMEEVTIDNKLQNIFGVLDFDITKTKEYMADDIFV